MTYRLMWVFNVICFYQPNIKSEMSAGFGILDLAVPVRTLKVTCCDGEVIPMGAHVPSRSVEGFCVVRTVSLLHSVRPPLPPFIKGNGTSIRARHDLTQKDAKQKLNTKPKFSPEQQTHKTVAGSPVLDPFGQCWPARIGYSLRHGDLSLDGFFLAGVISLRPLESECRRGMHVRMYGWVGVAVYKQPRERSLAFLWYVSLYHYLWFLGMSPPGRIPTDKFLVAVVPTCYIVMAYL